MEKYYLMCAVILLFSLVIIGMMHVKCKRKVEYQASKNAMLMKYISELGTLKDGIHLLLRNLPVDELENLAQIIQFHLEKIDKEYGDPDIIADERTYKRIRERWLAIEEKVNDEKKYREFIKN